MTDIFAFQWRPWDCNGQNVIGLFGPRTKVVSIINEYILALGKSLSDISNVLRQNRNLP